MSDLMTRMRELSNLVWRSARDTGEAAAEGLEQRMQIQRLATRVRRLDRERSDLIRQIGAKVYGLHGQGKVRNQDVLVDCRRIDQIIVDIGALRKEIEEVRAASLEKGIEVPILSDEAPLEDGEGAAIAAAPATAPAGVRPAGTVGEQDLPPGGVPRASQGRAEYDEEGNSLLCDEGPSAVSERDTCETDNEQVQSGQTPIAQSEIVGGDQPPPTGPSVQG